MSRRRTVPSLDLGAAGAAFGLGGGGSRFLFAVPPLPEHVAPTVAVGAELTRRGHTVAWTGPAEAIGPLLGRGARLYPAGDGEPARRIAAPGDRRTPWRDALVSFAHAALPDVEAAIDGFRPHVVIADRRALAAPVAARRRGVRWAASTPSPPEEEPEELERILDFQRACGEAEPADPTRSAELVLVFSTPELADDPVRARPGRLAFVGPMPERPQGGAFPWEWLDGARPAIVVSPGADDGGRLCRAAAEAVAGLTVQAVLVAPPDALPDPPPNALVRRRVPRGRLLPRMAAVVCRGGHDVVCRALAHGLPVVAAPAPGDRRAIARRVAETGAGLAVPDEPAALREAIAAVLEDPAYRRAARAVQRSIEAAGGAAEAADRLERLL
ncbi:glycosyltransferase [Thermomonospora catenispora]|uniref:glycosyltransferase n=1 Tax=Thermomonospora catenispora TaxID=2493090 RepID=UPI001124842E|nr:nucleotide disphospho-sugar-binding domain-containing protein [Thermomonospora catenispora]TNY34773.1 glycosyltransferase [Thermomonospora catenispora]